jgi:pyruvate dehydrogenase E2 component (dihydrolipoamide acetyltransferase)
VKVVVMPALGVAMSEGVVLAWLKKPGDAVRKGEPIMEIETDKTTVEVESPGDGILGPHLFEPDAVVPVGVAMTHILEDGDDLGGPAAPPDVHLPANLAEAPMGPLDAGLGPAPETPGPSGAGDTLDGDESGGGVAPGVRAPNRLSPRERRIARERELAEGTGPTDALSDAGTAPVAIPPAPGQPAATGGGALGRHRELIAAKVSESWRTIPHFAVTREIDASAMHAVRERWGDDRGRPSLTDLMLRALALALRAGGDPGPIDVGLAVATPHGVAIPVIRGVLALDPAGLRSERMAAVARARDGRLLPSDLTEPPRSTLSNLGAQGIDSFTGVIALGQMSLLTVGRVMPRAYVIDGAVSVRDTFFATLNVDHRYLDGDDAARLLIAFAAAAEDAERLEKEDILA